MLVGESTYNATKDDFFYLKVDDLQVKGKSVGLSVHTVLDGMNNNPDLKSKKFSTQMHEAQFTQKFDEAIYICEKLERHSTPANDWIL